MQKFYVQSVAVLLSPPRSHLYSTYIHTYNTHIVHSLVRLAAIAAAAADSGSYLMKLSVSPRVS